MDDEECLPCEQMKKARREAAANTPSNNQRQKQQLASFINVDDISVIEGGGKRDFRMSDWSGDKLLIFIPQAYTPVCKSELATLNLWTKRFDQLSCRVIAVSTDPAGMLIDWMRDEPLLEGSKFMMFSSYDLPKRLGALKNGRCRRVSMFVTEDDVVRQDHFDDVGRNFSELHRMFAAYRSGEKCGSNWRNSASNDI